MQEIASHLLFGPCAMLIRRLPSAPAARPETPHHHHASELYPASICLSRTSAAPPIPLRASVLLYGSHVCCSPRRRCLRRAPAQDRGTRLLISKPATLGLPFAAQLTHAARLSSTRI
jgi:hypothetical protein